LYVFMAMLCKIYNNNIHKEEKFFFMNTIYTVFTNNT
jgi:hypothetical protein